MKTQFICVIFLLLVLTQSLENGLGRTPQMGWNTWNKFSCNINEDLIKQTADTLVESGLAEAGYVYLNLDDCWQKQRDPKTGKIQVDSEKFPSGMDSLVQYIHSKGLKIGLYSDAGYRTCAGRPGSLGYEFIDAQSYSDWDIDYLKYDNCFTNNVSPKERYPVMSKALMAQKKQIFFSICEWGVEDPVTWATDLGNSWRTTQDIEDTWESFVAILDQQVGLEGYAGPGGWNDPDMLEVGNGGMTDDEYQSHFGLWALLKAPLIIGCDINNMSDATKRILMNKEIIAVNQDSLGKQGKRVLKDGDVEVWTVQVQDNTPGLVVVLFNRAYRTNSFKLDFETINIIQKVYVRDLINQNDLGVAEANYSVEIPPHSIKMLKFTKLSSNQ